MSITKENLLDDKLSLTTPFTIQADLRNILISIGIQLIWRCLDIFH